MQYFSTPADKALYLESSLKWSDTGRGSIDVGEMEKFLLFRLSWKWRGARLR